MEGGFRDFVKHNKTSFHSTESSMEEPRNQVSRSDVRYRNKEQFRASTIHGHEKLKGSENKKSDGSHSESSTVSEFKLHRNDMSLKISIRAFRKFFKNLFKASNPKLMSKRIVN